jgi:hypothetical protein
MEENKHIAIELVEHAIQQISSCTSSQNSQINNSDIEKRPRTNESDSNALIRVDDAVTAKTWAVVVVGCSALLRHSNTVEQSFRFSLHPMESPSGQFHSSARSNLRWPPNSALAQLKAPGSRRYTACAARFHS